MLSPKDEVELNCSEGNLMRANTERKSEQKKLFRKIKVTWDRWSEMERDCKRSCGYMDVSMCNLTVVHCYAQC